jgi:hypothetical protein
MSFEKLILRTIQKHIEERNLLNASQFGFRAEHPHTTSMYEAGGSRHPKVQQ